MRGAWNILQGVQGKPRPAAAQLVTGQSFTIIAEAGESSVAPFKSYFFSEDPRHHVPKTALDFRGS